MTKGNEKSLKTGKVLWNIAICVISFLIGVVHTTSGDEIYMIAGILIIGLSSFLFYSHLNDYRKQKLVSQKRIPDNC